MAAALGVEPEGYAAVSATAVEVQGEAGGPAKASGATPRRRALRAGGAALVAALLTAGAATAWFGGSSRRLRYRAGSALEGKSEAHHASQCGHVDEDTDYVVKSDYGYNMDHIPYPEMCCAMCFGDPKCESWVWVKDAGLEGCPSQCWLKGARPKVAKDKKKKKGVTAGLPPKRPKLLHDKVSEWDTVPHSVKKKAGPLFCFALMMPKGYETELIRWQHKHKAGIFGCDVYQVYSNVSFEVAKGVKTSAVNSTMKCGFGGDSGTALNSWIFIATFLKVLEDGLYRHGDWTVKVDPDTVFFSGRLRTVLQDYAGRGLGVMNNCRYGMHGPIEVFARSAMLELAKDYDKSWDGKAPKNCVKKQHFGQYGEDMFMDQCMSILKLKKSHAEPRLMCEAHCDCSQWYWCRNGTDRVSFHPFKTVGSYENCIANAMDEAHKATTATS